MASNEEIDHRVDESLPHSAFNGEERQFAESVRDEPLPQTTNQYPTRNEINRQIMDATRPLLDQIAELTRLLSTLVEPRSQTGQVASGSSTHTGRDIPFSREGNVTKTKAWTSR